MRFLELNPTAFEIFGFPIAWYAICILTGIILAVFVAMRELPRMSVDKNKIMDGVIWCVPMAILACRIYYVIFSWEEHWTLMNIIGFEDGEFVGLRGLAINGAIIFSAAFAYFFCKKHKINLYRVIDVLAPSLLIGQICGRWGNFFNQEAYGPAVDPDKLRIFLPDFIVNQMHIGSYYYHPTFLYEMLWNILGLSLILVTRRMKKAKIKIGDYLPLYLVWYGLFRGLVIEPMRQDPLMLGGIKINILVNIVIAMAGITFLILKRKPWFREKIGLEDKYYVEALAEDGKDKHAFI